MVTTVVCLGLLFGATVAQRDESSAVPRGLKLDLVQAFFRHGERTSLPIEYASYPYLDASVYEPYGFGQLTNRGKEQMYNVGRMLRKRYDGHLSEKYVSEEVYAYSSADDRTKTSLQLVLAGLYPPTPGFVWNPNLEWIPLPFRYTPREVDVLMKSYESKECDQMLQQVRRGPEYVRAVSKHSGVFDLMRNKTNMLVSYHCPNPVIGMFNLLQINEKLGLPLPDWYTEEVKREHRSAYAEVMRSKAHTIRQRRLDGGPLVRTTLENMNLNGSLTNPRKIYLYSGHDMTLYGFFKALDVGDHDHVDFGTTIVLEKLRDSRNNRVFVRFLVYSPIEDKTIAVRVGACGEFCPAEDYVKHIANVVPTDEERDVLLNEFNVGRLKDLFFVDEMVRKPSAQAREFDPDACVYKNNAQKDWNDV